jgi:hypothetical protein
MKKLLLIISAAFFLMACGGAKDELSSNHVDSTETHSDTTAGQQDSVKTDSVR